MACNASNQSRPRSPVVEEIDGPAQKRSKTHHAEVDEVCMDQIQMACNASDLSRPRSPVVAEIDRPAHKRSKTHHAEVDEVCMEVSEGHAVSEVTISAALGQKLSSITHIPVLVKITPPDGTRRTPADICCVIDVSISMGSEAKIQGDSGATESQGLTLLDIAKHGLRTIAHTLRPEDRLCIVAFNHGATTILNLTQMDDIGRALADQKIDELTPGGYTDIWKGLLEGLECLRIGGMDRAAQRFGHLMVLTDGETQHRESVLPGLANYSQQHEGLPGTICTFGFGYSLDSWLLTQIALVGNGSYSFIPDAGFVGTAFVNTLSNLLATYARSVLMSCGVDPEKGEVLAALGHDTIKDSGGIQYVNLGSLQFGQSKDVVLFVKMTVPDATSLDIGLRYEANSGEIRTSSKFFEQITTNLEMVESQLLRIEFVEVLRAALAKCATTSTPEEDRLVAAQAVKSLSVQARKSTAASCASVKALIEDMDGQTSEAFSSMKFFSKWGRHYIPSLMLAHMSEQCNNFKDPGVQLYGGQLFHSVREEADNIFDTLPPPKPTARASVRSRSVTPVNMAAYNNRFSG